MFHPTIDWAKPILSLSPITPVPYSKLEFGITWDKPKHNQTGNPKENYLHPQATMISPNTRSKNHQNQYKLGCLKFSSPYPKDFFCLHPPVKGSLGENHLHPQPWDFPETTSTRIQNLLASKDQPNREPTTPWLSRKWHKAMLYMTANPRKYPCQ